MIQDTENRWQTILKIWEDNRWLFGILGLVTGLVLGFLAGLSAVNGGDFVLAFVDGIWPEVLSTFFAITVIDQLNRRRDLQNRIIDLQERLVHDAGSSVNNIALQALYELRGRSWLEGEEGLLKKANLEGANLSEANLKKANLANTKLWRANLTRANLRGANLISTSFVDADLIEADLGVANLSEANLQRSNLSDSTLRRSILKRVNLNGANLQGANLEYSNLSGASLAYANLSGANLYKTSLKNTLVLPPNTNDFLGSDITTKFDENTILPDGTKWTPETDWTHFGAIIDNAKWIRWDLEQQPIDQ